MPRDDDDRPRRRDDYDDDRPKPKSNAGLIIGIIAVVILVPLVACGVGGYYLFMTAKDVVTQVGGTLQGELAAIQFLTSLSNGDTELAYGATTAAFKEKMSRADLQKLVDQHPILKNSNSHTPNGAPTPTGKEPNRTMVITFQVTNKLDPGGVEVGMDEKEKDKDKPKTGEKVNPKTGEKVNPKDEKDKPKEKEKEKFKAVSVTVTVVEQPDNTWKVDGFKVD